MKKILTVILSAILSFSVIPVHAEGYQGDPLGIKILQQYTQNDEAKYTGMTMQLTEGEIKTFNAGKYYATYEHSAAWDVTYRTQQHGIEITEYQSSSQRGDTRCAPMKLDGSQLQVQPQMPVDDFDMCR